MRIARGIVPRVLPLSETVIGYFKPAQETVRAGMRRYGRSVLQRCRPVAAGGEFRLQHCRRASPERGDERPREADNVKQRQVNLVDVVWPQLLLQRADLATPEDIRVGP